VLRVCISSDRRVSLCFEFPVPVRTPRPAMTAHVQGSNVLDVLKKKMRATKEESEKYKEDCEDLQRKLQVEIMRREEVTFLPRRA
jgi:hypothetical protein